MRKSQIRANYLPIPLKKELKSIYFFQNQSIIFYIRVNFEEREDLLTKIQIISLSECFPQIFSVKLKNDRNREKRFLITIELTIN